MDNKIPTRETAFELLCNYNRSDSLIKHALAVEGVMRHFARLRGRDEEKWGVIGLIHDLDYEQYPDRHCQKSADTAPDHPPERQADHHHEGAEVQRLSLHRRLDDVGDELIRRAISKQDNQERRPTVELQQRNERR